MNKQYDRYSMRIQWDDKDRIFIVTVPELPGCITHGSTYEEAISHGREAIETWIEGSLAFGLPIPEPRVLMADAA